MSYPREIRALIVEDEPHMVETYEETFKDLNRECGDIAPPVICESLDDAIDRARGNDIFHLCILDIRLPEQTGGTEASARGLELVPILGSREIYPIPILIVITADPAWVTNLPMLEEQMATYFWHSEVLKKGLAMTEQLPKAIERARQYAGIGIHLVDEHDEAWPPLNPREEDLLRRAILLDGNAVGVDLRWWGADRRDGFMPDGVGWVKVLQGRLLLAEGAQKSRPRFFKFASPANIAAAAKSANVLAAKVQHAAVLRSISVGSRGLLVTDKAGPTNDPPIPLTDLLGFADLSRADTQTLADDIHSQLCALSNGAPSQVPVSTLLWRHHTEERISEGWKRAGGADDEASNLWRKLADNSTYVVVRKRMCHGDLHIGNVAADMDIRYRAYIIDPGPMQTEPVGRDTAALEISLLLHQTYAPGVDVIAVAEPLLDGSDPSGTGIDYNQSDRKVAMTLALISALRGNAFRDCSESTYALLLMDYLLIQIGGIAFGSTGNKIVVPHDVVRAFALISEWLREAGVMSE